MEQRSDVMNTVVRKPEHNEQCAYYNPIKFSWLRAAWTRIMYRKNCINHFHGSNCLFPIDRQNNNPVGRLHSKTVKWQWWLFGSYCIMYSYLPYTFWYCTYRQTYTTLITMRLLCNRLHPKSLFKYKTATDFWTRNIKSLAHGKNSKSLLHDLVG